MKYHGTRLTLYLPPGSVPQIRNIARPLSLAESAYKALSLAAQGVPAIGFQGCYGWSRDGEMNPLWNRIPLAGREVWIFADSNVVTKPYVFQAYSQLTVGLLKLGARVTVIPTPEGFNGPDDWLGTGKTIRDLLALPVLDFKHPHPASPEYQAVLGRERLTFSAREQIRTEHAAVNFRAPDWHVSLREEPPVEDIDEAWTVPNLHQEGTNTLIPAMPGAGKTTLMLNYARSWARGNPFVGLGLAKLPPGRRVALINWEMTGKMLRRWLARMGIKDNPRISVMDLRDLHFPITSPEARTELVRWLREVRAHDLVIDTLRRLMADCGMSIKDNDDAGLVTALLDEIKGEAGVVNLFLTAHTPRPLTYVDGERVLERALGAQTWDSWPDNIWFYSNQDGARFLVPTKVRDGELPDKWSWGVSFDPETKLLAPTGINRAEEAERLKLSKAARAAQIAARNPGIVTRAIYAEIGGKIGDAQAAVDKAKQLGWIIPKPGPKNAVLHHSAKADEWMDAL
jgi:hypothetical protein